MGIGTSENHTLLGKLIQMRCEATSRTQESHAVRAGGVEGNNQDIGSRFYLICCENRSQQKKNQRKLRPPHKEKGSLAHQTPCFDPLYTPSENQFQAEVHVAWPALGDDRVAGSHV